MKKILHLIVLLALLNSCGTDTPFNQEKKYYRTKVENIELYLTFINDTIVALNSDSFKSCNWTFDYFEKSNAGLFKTDELKIDTVWIRPKEKGISLNSEEEDLFFEEIELPDSKKDSLLRQIKIVERFREKGIFASCDFTFKEISYFYENAVQKTKEQLKNPSSSIFKEVKIDKYKFTNKEGNYVNSTTTIVSLKVDAKNGFGNFTEDTYYIYFIPQTENKSIYNIEFSASLLSSYELENRITE